jgi:DNA-binding PadR family transcriptional regulator
MNQLTPDFVLLGLLAAQPCHGYQLLDVFRQPDQLGQVWNMSKSQLYAVLKRLEKNAWIDGREEVVGDTPPRTVYSLTAAGEEQLETWLWEKLPSSSVRRVRVEFLSRLYIARLLNQPTIPIVHAQQATCLERRDQLMAERNATKPGIGFLAVDLVIMQLNAVLQWITRCELIPQGLDDEE